MTLAAHTRQEMNVCHLICFFFSSWCLGAETKDAIKLTVKGFCDAVMPAVDFSNAPMPRSVFVPPCMFIGRSLVLLSLERFITQRNGHDTIDTTWIKNVAMRGCPGHHPAQALRHLYTATYIIAPANRNRESAMTYSAPSDPEIFVSNLV
ncbi:hypothetical protein DFH11DRAFT_891636 [Phellopilus nigrolimitatus]|nr:hypothetical protein DFH11DRAFT_891636 [Phellopilus nigrolimitatus]